MTGKDVNISAALRLRIKAMLASGLSPAEIATRLAATDAFPMEPAAVEESVKTVAAEIRDDIPPPLVVLDAAQPEEPPTPPISDAADAPREPDLYNDVSRLFSLLDLTTTGGAPGTVLQFIGSHRREGTSTIAREFARVCAVHSDRAVLLLDLDLARDGQYEAFSRRGAKNQPMSKPVNLGIDLGKIVRLDKEIPALPPTETLITVHRVGETSLHVSRVNPRVRGHGVTPHVTRAPECWEQVRRNTTLTIVDSPPLTDSFDGLAIASLVDRVVVVMEAESTRLPVVSELCDRLTQQQAPLSGVVFNKRRFYIPRFIYRWL